MNPSAVSWLIDTLIVTGGLIALVLILRGPVSRHFGPGMAYALWALPLLRLVMPPLVLPAPDPAGTALLVEVSTDAIAPTAPIAAPAANLAWVEPLLLAAWLAGVITFLLWRAHGYVTLRRTILANARPVGSVGPVRLVESAATPGPLAFGVLDRVVALPLGFMTQADRSARDLAIAHELEHHAGRDLLVNLAMQPLLALHWFNPLAWLAWRALRRDQEAACDARVVAGRDSHTRAAYGALIAEYARAPRTSLAASLACPVVGEASVVHRLRTLTMTDPTPTRRNLGRLLLAGCALALPLTASISYAAQETSPAAPQAPDAPAAPKITKQHRIMIVDHPDGADPKDPKLQSRVIEKDGKTIVFKSAKPLSDAEIAERIAKAEASMKEAEAMVWSSKDGTGNDGTSKDGKREHRIVTVLDAGDKTAAVAGDKSQPNVMIISGDKAIALPEIRARVMKMTGSDGKPTRFATLLADSATACKDGAQVSEQSSESTVDGQRKVVRMRFCQNGQQATASALEGLKKARERLSKNSELSAEIKDQILKGLDEEIAKLSKQG